MNTTTVEVSVVVVTCICGNFPLERAMHRTSQQAWLAAAKHVELNPQLCKPRMYRSTAPSLLAPAA
jgi:hypothetical protein